MHHYRHTTLAAINYTSIHYLSPSSRWMRRSYMQPQAMLHDRYLYDPTSGYSVDRYLDDLNQRYGGIDSVLLWHSYPNIGVDARNQFDMLRSLPGYPEQVKQMIGAFHERGVRVLFPYNPWDIGTNQSSPSQLVELIDELALLGADGFNGDTMTGIPSPFFDYAFSRYNLTLMLQAEVGLSTPPVELSWQLASWGYWSAEPSVVSLYKWLEPRFTVNICNRWARSHTVDLLQSWINGVGFETWENVWGIWIQISDRDAQAVKQLATMSRHLWHVLSEATAILPHYPTQQSGVVSFFYWSESTNQSVFTVINQGQANVTGTQLVVQYDVDEWMFVDCYHGRFTEPQVVDGGVGLAFDVEAGGFGCVAVIPKGALDSDWKRFMQKMSRLTSQPLSSFSTDPGWLQQQHVSSPPTSFPSSTPANMTLILGSSDWWFNVSGVEVEGPDGYAVDVQYSQFGETVAQRHHALLINVSSFYVDTAPVSRQQYGDYLTQSGYQPTDPTHFLRQWQYEDGQWRWPASTGDVPVTCLSLDEARQYCHFYSKRLIEEWEYQYVAQNGHHYSTYPWDGPFNSSFVPPPTSSPTAQPYPPSPLSASLAGVVDLTSNKWEWTSQFDDQHTRRAVLRGGSRYRPEGSMWYFPGLESGAGTGAVHGLWLLMGGGMDRSELIGFRCVMDAMQGSEGSGGAIVAE